MRIRTIKILIIIPAYNEESTMVSVLEALKSENPHWDIIVVNDCSKDKTGFLAEDSKKAMVVNLPFNLGIGGAVQTGFKYARNNDYDIAVKFDGDGQHIAPEIPKLLAPIISNEADVVIGSRFCKKSEGYKSNLSRRIGIKIFEIVNSLLIKQHITDNTSGFNAFNRKAICFLSENYPTDYPEPETVVLLGRNGFRVKEVYTTMQERKGGKSSISGMKAFIYMYKVLLSVFMCALRKRVIRR